MGTVDIERWSEMPLVEQMTNIGSEVGRTRDLFTESYLSSDILVNLAILSFTILR